MFEIIQFYNFNINLIIVWLLYLKDKFIFILGFLFVLFLNFLREIYEYFVLGLGNDIKINYEFMNLLIR